MSGCSECNGIGSKALKICPACKGSGFVEDGMNGRPVWAGGGWMPLSEQEKTDRRVARYGVRK